MVKYSMGCKSGDLGSIRLRHWRLKDMINTLANSNKLLENRVGFDIKKKVWTYEKTIAESDTVPIFVKMSWNAN